MDEDDTDFIPSPNLNSKLANLFTKKPLQGNSSLTYTAPKPPKVESTPVKKPTEEKIKSKIIFSKAVQAYLLQNKTYVSQGLIGLVISGNHESGVYDIILYKRNKEHLSLCRIVNNLSITLSPNNYVSYYDNNKQNWSLMFQSAADAEQFSLKVAICKYYSFVHPPTQPLVQDLTPTSQTKATSNNTVDVIYNINALTPEETSVLGKDVSERINLKTYGFLHLREGLVGCGEKCKRVIIIPYSLGGPWQSKLHSNNDMLLEVKIERILPETPQGAAEAKVLQEGAKSSVDSSEEDAAFRARADSVKEAMPSTKFQKANLISRMARMGQATLPVRVGPPSVQSDSEEEDPLISSPKLKARRCRAIGASPPVNNSYCQTSTETQQVSVYQQSELPWQKPGAVYQQLVPVSASQASSPTTDPNLSVFASESRIQAAELRMGISKVSEKLDAIWSKMQTMSGGGTESKMCQAAVMDSGGILTSIQGLITENENLKEKVEEQKGKIEQQNDRIFQLLELNHKYLEQNSTTHEMQSASESKFKTELESLRRKELDLESSNRKALEKVKSLTEGLAQSEEANKELKIRLEESKAEAEALRKDLEQNQDKQKKESETFKRELSTASEAISRLEGRLKDVISENRSLKSEVENQKKEIETGNKEMEDSETRKKEREREMESLKKQMSEEGLKAESRIAVLTEVVAKLEDEKKSLLKKLEEQGNQNNRDDVLPQMLSALKDRFADSKEYSSSEIVRTFEKIFEGVVDGSSEPVEKSEAAAPETPAEKREVVPAPRKSLQNLQPPRKEKEEEEKGEVAESIIGKESEEKAEENNGEGKTTDDQKENEEKSGNDDQKLKEERSGSEERQQKKETDSRYKSYDQGWRTTKPPPPPLFDDEDDADDWVI